MDNKFDIGLEQRKPPLVLNMSKTHLRMLTTSPVRFRKP